jgi:hypothetical protein
MKHSVLGIASLITNLAVIFISALFVIVSLLNDAPAGQIPSSIFFFFPFVSLVALGLGIGGLLQKDRKKIFAVLGAVFSCVIIGIFIGIASLLFIQLLNGM